jgi:hypothetical protein
MQQTNQRHKAAKKRLIAGCKGLLEPHYRSQSDTGSLPSSVLFEYRVDFLHRTVRDYLELPTTDIKHWAPTGFDPHEAICRALYAQIKTAPDGHEYRSHILTLYDLFEIHADAFLALKKGKSSIPGLQKELRTMLWDHSVEIADIPTSEDAGTRTAEVDGAIPTILEHKADVLLDSKAPDESKSLLKAWKSKLSRRRSRSSDKKNHA